MDFPTKIFEKELSSTTDPHESSKKPTSNQLKIYNIMYNNFSYEHDVLLQKNFKEMDMDKSTPSLLSEQSFLNTNFCNKNSFFKTV